MGKKATKVPGGILPLSIKFVDNNVYSAGVANIAYFRLVDGADGEPYIKYLSDTDNLSSRPKRLWK